MMGDYNFAAIARSRIRSGRKAVAAETKEFASIVVKSIDVPRRRVTAIASTSDLDRDKERILPSAFAERIDSFKSNPVILAAHQHRLDDGSPPVIGSVLPESISIGTDSVTFTMEFGRSDLAEQYWVLYRDKHMRAFSVGFIPLEWTDERDEKLGMIRTYTKIELLEISAVAVPSNRAALSRSKARKEEFVSLKQLESEMLASGEISDEKSLAFAEALMGYDENRTF